MLSKMRGVPIATDVHAIATWMTITIAIYAGAHILFMSDELLPGTPEHGARAVGIGWHACGRGRIGGTGRAAGRQR